MKMKELFDRGEFVVSAEVGPPKGIHVDELVEEAKTYLKDVHAVNVTDNQSSVMRLVPLINYFFHFLRSHLSSSHHKKCTGNNSYHIVQKTIPLYGHCNNIILSLKF